MNKTRIRLFPRIKPRRGTLTTEGNKGQRYCPNCHYPLPHYGEFCSNCGQQYTDGRVPLKFLLQDFIDNVLNIDSKLFRTTWALIRPGKLTNEFFAGHHKRFASPARLFFIATVVHFAMIGFVINDELATGLGKLVEKNRRQAYEAPLLDSLQKAREEVSSMFAGQATAQRALDSLFTKIKSEKRDSQDITYFSIDSNWNITSKDVTLSIEELYRKTPAELATANGISGKLENLIFQQAVKVNTHVDNFGQYMLGQFVWMVILMMPALALILKLLYVRRRRYFVEHLVFSFHYHAFAFWVVSISLFLLALTDSWENDKVTSIASIIVIFGILIYLFIAMRRVYKQGFFKTFVKYNILNFAYLMIFFLFLSLTFVVSALMY